MSAIQLLTWFFNIEKLRSASADKANRVHPNTNKIVMSGKISRSADSKDFINVSGKLALSACLDRMLNHLDTSLSNGLEVGRSSCHDSYCFGRHIYSLTTTGGIRLSKALTGLQLSAEKWLLNCCSKISIKGMPIYLL